MMGVAVIAKRMWTLSPTKQPSTILCGAALSHNRASSEERWRAFVESIPMAGDSSLRVSA
jgi:hypothetical protein